VKRKPLIGHRALQARTQIDSLLAGTGWFLTVETRVQDAIQLDLGETIRDDLKLMFKRGRFDFVIVTADEAVPHLVIELDGPSHEEPLVMDRDARKDELCLLAGLPIARLPVAHVEVYDQATVLEWIIGEFVRFQKEYPALCREIAHQRSDASEATLDTLARADWIAHHRRRFPAIDRVVERLASRFSIFEDDPPRSFPPADEPLVVETFGGLVGPTVTSRVRREGEVIYSTSQPIPMSRRTADIFELDLLGPSVTGREHIDVGLAFACFHAIGWHRHEIDEQVAMWFALREVERWAQRAVVQ
jgi:hypothetical protein